MTTSLERTCHLCSKVVESRVWYSTTREEGRRKKRRLTRVYACPACFFEDLDESDRAAYQREAVSTHFSGAAL